MRVWSRTPAIVESRDNSTEKYKEADNFTGEIENFKEAAIILQ